MLDPAQWAAPVLVLALGVVGAELDEVWLVTHSVFSCGFAEV